MTELFRQAREAADERLVRVSQLFWLATLTAHDVAPRAFEDLIEYELEEGDELLKALPELGPVIADEKLSARERTEFALAELARANRGGFLAQLEGPVKTRRKSGFAYSWGHTQLHWVYCESLEQLVEEMNRWEALDG